jgi:hypothetical protein
MGCSVRFAGNPGRTKERRIERLAGQHAPRPEKAKETRRVEAEGEAEMSENEKSTDPGLSAAERKELRGREAKEAVADHEAAQQAFHENRERLREERLAREAAAGPMLYPAPELPDDTPIQNVRFSTRIRNAVTAVGWQTVGEIREASDATLLGLQDLGPGSVTSLRETLGLPSCDGVRPLGKKPA